MATIQLENVTKEYRHGEFSGPAVSDVSLTVQQGEFIFLVGSRGAGKSTLLKLLSGHCTPTRGRVYLDGAPVRGLSLMQRSRLRSLVGWVHQEQDLVRTRTVRWNLTPRSPIASLEDRLAGEPLVEKALGLVGMPGVEERYPAEFSYSDCRRIELARAILHSPALLIMDEITDKMDDGTTWDLLHLLSELNAHGTSVIMVTNAARYINMYRKRVITMADGKIVSDVPRGRYQTLSSRGGFRQSREIGFHN